jgi:hypothetical protein
VAEWLKAADCKSALIEYAGSNPALPTIIFKQSVHHYGERFFVLAGLGSNHCRIRNCGEAKGLSRSEAKSGDCRSIPNPALPTIIFKQSVHHYGERFFVLAGLGSKHCRIRNGGEAKGLSRSEAKSGDCRSIPNPALPTIIFKQSVHHYGERFFVLAGLGSNHCRIRNGASQFSKSFLNHRVHRIHGMELCTSSVTLCIPCFQWLKNANRSPFPEEIREKIHLRKTVG